MLKSDFLSFRLKYASFSSIKNHQSSEGNERFSEYRFRNPSKFTTQIFVQTRTIFEREICFWGEDLRRSYSIVNAPTEGNTSLEILVKHIENGKVSTFLSENLKSGDIVEVSAPMGHFYTHYHPSNEKTYVGIAAGSGISPVLSNLKEALYQEPKSKAYLLFSNKSLNDIIFKKKLMNWCKNSKADCRLFIYFLAKNTLKTNCLKENFCQKTKSFIRKIHGYSDSGSYLFYLCNLQI
ncbi:hypothetical protein LDL59_02615 [Kaistella anthropi]|nr:hypothetical protein [Kaistella anthropi]